MSQLFIAAQLDVTLKEFLLVLKYKTFTSRVNLSPLPLRSAYKTMLLFKLSLPTSSTDPLLRRTTFIKPICDISTSNKIGIAQENDNQGKRLDYDTLSKGEERRKQEGD